MDFYYGRVSGNSARVAFTLYEAGIDFTPRLVDTRRAGNRTSDYLALNPMGKVPALIDAVAEPDRPDAPRDGASPGPAEVRLWESNAINWYIAEKMPEAGLLPTTAVGRASVHKWLFFQTGHVSPACGPIFMSTNRKMLEFWSRPAEPRAVESGRAELARFLPVLEEALQGRDWLERSFSLADIAYAPHLWLIGEGGFDFSPTPAVRAWLDRLVARPAWGQAVALIFGD